MMGQISCIHVQERRRLSLKWLEMVKQRWTTSFHGNDLEPSKWNNHFNLWMFRVPGTWYVWFFCEESSSHVKVPKMYLTRCCFKLSIPKKKVKVLPQFRNFCTPKFGRLNDLKMPRFRMAISSDRSWMLISRRMLRRQSGTVDLENLDGSDGKFYLRTYDGIT